MLLEHVPKKLLDYFWTALGAIGKSWCAEAAYPSRKPAQFVTSMVNSTEATGRGRTGSHRADKKPQGEKINPFRTSR
jgi:hypothetical protein